jgi:RimJ/RimL family protein N-acetyltransferase
LGDAELMKYYPAPFSRDETIEWIRSNLERYERDGHGLWAMELKATGELIGDCGLVVQDVDGDIDVEVGWHVRRDMCNRGFATEAAEACRDYVFEELGLVRLISLVRPENAASCRVAEKIGMTVERHTVRGPGWDHWVYSLRR